MRTEVSAHPTAPRSHRTLKAHQFVVLAVWVACALAVPTPRPADAHPHLRAPPIELTIRVIDGALKFSGSAEQDLLRKALDWPTGKDLPPVERATDWLDKTVEILLDGEAIELQVATLSWLMTGVHPDGTPRADAIGFRGSRSLERIPQSVALAWRDFDGILWENEISVPVTLYLDGGVVSGYVSPEEHVHVWHRTDVQTFRKDMPIEEVKGWQAPPTTRSTPVLALVLGIAGLALLFLPRPRLTRTRWLRAGGAWATAGLCLAFGLGTYTVTRPATPAELLPTVDGAREIAEMLVGNVYASFDLRRKAIVEAEDAQGTEAAAGLDPWNRRGLSREDEDAIYDLLAKSAGPKLLPEVYRHVYRSLVMEDQSGSFSLLERVEWDERVVTFPPPGERPVFEVDGRWATFVAVHHLGHTHRRKNKYRATFTIAHDGRSWKLDRMLVHEHERESLDEEQTADSTSGYPFKGRG